MPEVPVYSIPQTPSVPLLVGSSTPTRREWIRFWNSLFANVGGGKGNVVLANAENEWTAPQTFDEGDLIASNVTLLGSTSGTTILQAQAISGDTTITFPAETDTVALLDATQSFENKTLNGNDNTIGGEQLVGTATNDSASAGNVGELISSSIPSGSAVGLTTATPTDITHVALTAGDWDVWGNIVFSPAGTTTISAISGWLSGTSATVPTLPNAGAYTSLALTFTTGAVQSIPAGAMRVSVPSAGADVYLSCQASFGVSTMSAYGFIGARRRR